MHHDGSLRGALVGRLPSESQGVDEALNLLREFASRMAVALSAIERERALFLQAHFDELTGLPNRQLFYDRLGQALVRARRERHELAVLFIDLDGFKTVNDSLGHSFGDELLRETALRITATLRDTDTVARIGGDEYVVILPHVNSILEVESVVEKLLAILRRPFAVGGQDSFVGASIGVTMFPDDGTTVEELLRKADTAMYAAKESGRGRCVFFAPVMDSRVQERLAMQTDLRNALTNGEFSVVYQPQVLFGTGSLICAEALLRWTHPVRGSVPPGVFVPILEESGLIDEVGAWVMERALSDFVRWRRAGVQIDRVSVNVATQQLFQPGFAGHVVAALNKTGLPGTSLELELTEHGLVRDFRKTNDIFRELRRAGVRVAIDDFGTGYSSLVYLRELTFDVLKIDRAFVMGLPEQKSMAIVQAVLAVAHALGKTVVAEGVESELHERVLKDLGCDFAQGYLFSVPLGSEEFVAWAVGRATGSPASTALINAR
jgi:diguanylate cyclase (GGDEF)-like protein